MARDERDRLREGDHPRVGCEALRGLAGLERKLRLLDWMRELGLLDESIFKGGTALRKFVFGLQGRFSLDLDFATMDRAVGELVIDELESGFTHEGVTFVGFDIGQMLKLVEATFGTVAPPLSAQEEVIVRCSRGDRYRVEQWHDERRAAFYANA